MSSADQRGTAAGSAYWLRSRPRQYWFALLAVATAILLRYRLDSIVGFPHPFLLFYPTIMLIALLVGFGPALFATLLSVTIDAYVSLQPFNSFARNIVGLILFGLTGIAMSWMGDLFRRRTKRLEEFQKAVEGLEEMIAVIDRDYRYVIANRAYLDYGGMKKEDLIGRQVSQVLGPGVFETKIKGKLDECFQGKIVQYEMQYKYPSRGERDLAISYFPIQGPAGIDRVACVLKDLTDVTERKRAQSALSASEKRYRLLFERNVAGVAITSMDGVVVDCNDAWARILGYRNADEVRGHPASEFYFNPAEGDPLVYDLRQEGVSLSREMQLRRKNGSPVWVLFNSEILSGSPEQEPLIQATAIDITERKSAEEALQQREEDYHSFVAKSSEGIFREELDTPIAIDLPEDEIVHHLLRHSYMAECNDAMGKMYGFDSGHELLGKRLGEMLVVDDPRNIELTREYIRSGFKVVERESHEIDNHGNPKVFRNSMIGIVEKGKLVRTWGIQRDVTEQVKAAEGQRKAEQSLAKSEERFRVALKDSPITVFNQDRDLRYTWIYNPQLCWQHAAVGKTDEEIFGPKKAGRLSELKRTVLREGKAVRDEVIVLYEGKRYAFDMTIEPLFDASGTLIGITGASIDIARLREMTDRLQEACDRLAQEKTYLEGEIQAELGFEEIIGQSPALREVLKNARVVAPTDSTVLLMGETGTGKELVARSVHSLSSRHDKTFVKLNCAAVPSGLLESELFGHEKGAFTGAVSQKVGRIELADKGTLFLDEIGELPVELQPKLLRVLQDREFERLGGIHTLRVDVRIISATNRDLHQDIADRKFREDLFYRLNVFPIDLPSLRRRRSDIPILVHHFVRKHSARMGKHIEVIPEETMKVLKEWNWPGNIRELENMIERMVILSKGRVLAEPPMELDVVQEVSDDNLTEMEREHVIRVLRETGGVLSGADGAASRLGMKRTTLQSMLKRLGIQLQDFRRANGTFGPE